MEARLNYIAVTTTEGEVIAFYDEGEETIVKEGYNVCLGYDEPLFETTEDRKVYMVTDDEELENL